MNNNIPKQTIKRRKINKLWEDANKNLYKDLN